MRNGTVVAVVLGALLIALAAGCGSKKSSTAATTKASAGQSSGSGSSSGKPSFASTRNCAELASLAAKVAQSVTPSGNRTTIDLSKEADALDALAAAAPDEIKGDFHTFADAFKGFAKAYGDAKIKVGRTPSAEQVAKLTAAAKALDTAKVQAAVSHLSAWGNSHCSGLSGTSP